MKKILFTGLVLLSLLAMSTGAALAAGASVSLVEVRNDSGGGVIFVFKVSGEFSKSELNNGYVQVQGGDNYGLYCNQVDESTVQCSTSKKTGDQNVAVNFGGSTFWIFVPPARSSGVQSQYCYGVYDVYYYSDEEPGLYWKMFDTYCQNEPASYGDSLENYYNPDFDEYYSYVFLPESPSCADKVEDAYYLPITCYE